MVTSVELSSILTKEEQLKELEDELTVKLYDCFLNNPNIESAELMDKAKKSIDYEERKNKLEKTKTR